MDVIYITSEMIFLGRKRKRDKEAKKKSRRWVRVAVAVFAAVWLLIGR